MRVLMTGGSGFIGTNLVQHYLAAGAEMLNLDIEAPVNAGHAAVWRKVDLLDLDWLAATIGEFDPLFCRGGANRPGRLDGGRLSRQCGRCRQHG